MGILVLIPESGNYSPPPVFVTICELKMVFIFFKWLGEKSKENYFMKPEFYE